MRLPDARAGHARIRPAFTSRKARVPNLTAEATAMIQEVMREEDGATAIEYGLIAALISLAALLAFQSLGLNLAAVFDTVTRAMGGG